jgi:uncharacterized membrane protein (DUF2068 family)
MHPKIPHPRIPHPIVHDPEHIKGVRAVATVEFTKGILVVLAGMGVLSMRHKDIVGVAESLLEFLHVNAHHHHHLFGIFVDLVHRISDVRLWKIATVVAVYVTLRFVEAYGLWYVRPWAEWLAFASGAIYIVAASNLVSIVDYRGQRRDRALYADAAAGSGKKAPRGGSTRRYLSRSAGVETRRAGAWPGLPRVSTFRGL